MKTFLLVVLALCMTHVEMRRKVVTERGHRPKSKTDQGSHHGRRDAGAGRSIRQILRKNLLHQNRRVAESKSSSRVSRSIIVKDYGSGHAQYAMGTNSAGVDHGFGSGFSSGYGSGSSFAMPVWLNDGIQTGKGSQTRKTNQKLHNSLITRTPTHSDRNTNTREEGSNLNFVLKPKVEPIKSKAGIISVLRPPARKVKRSVFQFVTGSGDASSSSGSSSDEGNVISLDAPESSGFDTIEEVIINSNVIQMQYVQGQGELVAPSTGSGGSTCVGDGCEHGSGSMNSVDAQISTNETPTNSVVQRVTGEQISYSGMYAVDHRP